MKDLFALTEMAMQEMGAINKARHIEAHDAYHTTMDLDTFKNMYKLSTKVEDGSVIGDGLALTLYNDLKADLDNSNIDRDNAIKHYTKYFNVIKNDNNIYQGYLNKIEKLLNS